MNLIRAILKKLTGHPAFVDGIVSRGSDNITSDEHDIVYQEGWDLITPYMPLHKKESRAARSRKAMRNVERGITLLEFVTEANPENWSAFWGIGKGYQALGNSDAACDFFGKAFARQKENPDVAREYMFECLNLGRHEDGISAAKHAVSLNARDPGLLANLALAHFINANLESAMTAVNESLELAPRDPITRNLRKAIESVQAGKKPQPHRLTDL